jgi:hypothetical protein
MTDTAYSAYNKSVDVLNMPDRIRRLPVSPLGWPVPWFVSWFDLDGKPCEDHLGIPDFRVIDPRKMVTAVKQHRCWVCGQTKSSAFHAFVIGPMCAITKTISEPSSHRDCAIWSARVCPFLSRPRMVRNEKGMYSQDGTLLNGLKSAAGVGLKRNPGAVCVWVTKSFKPFRPPGGGVLFSLGTPTEVFWFAEGKRATRKQIMDSIDSGYPTLEELAREEGPAAMRALATQREWAMQLVPDA